MDTVVLSSLLNGALLLVCVGLLLSFCVSCGQSWRQTPIHPQGGFGIIHVKAHNSTVVPDRYNHAPGHGVSNPANSLTPAPSSLRSPWQEPEHRPSYTPTEDDDDYVNQPEVDDSNRESYIEVLPGGTSSLAKNESQPRVCSGKHEIYVNVEQESENGEYINVLDHENGGLTPGKSQESMESDENGSTDYVNTSPK